MVLLACWLSSACAPKFGRLMRDWEQRPLSQLLITWGAPRAVYGDGRGGFVIAYVPDGTAQPPRDLRPAMSGSQLAHQLLNEPGTWDVYTPRVSARWPVYRLFFVNAAGTIYQSLWKGDWECCGF